MEEEGKMITDWLDQHGNPEIEKQVEKQLMDKIVLEEAAERHYINCIPSDRHSFIAGAKWQAERMYSEEEVKEILEKRDKHNLGNLTLGSRWLTVEDWFEQLKKK